MGQFLDKRKVIYSNTEKDKLIHKILYSYFLQFFKNKNSRFHNAYTELLELSLNMLFPIFKNNAFKNENEVRIIFDKNNFIKYNMPEIRKHYRNSNNLLIPYVETSNLFWEIDNIKIPMIDIKISKIILGPTIKHKELAKQSVEDFLQENDYSNTIVEFSKLPYR